MNEEHRKLLIKQYGFIPTIDSWYGQRSVDYWLYYQFDYSLGSTKLLLSLLNNLRHICYHDYRMGYDYPKHIKIVNGLKKILNTREHIPNKIERKNIRKEIFKLKKY